MNKIWCLALLTILSMYAKPRLIDFGFNIFSQFGEDGIISKILEILGAQSKVAVEFGAWNGFYLSNTAYLWGNDLSWKAILIEGDEKRFEELKKNMASYKWYNCVPIKSWVGIGQNDSLEVILKTHGINEPIDILSIDIDGNDYYILESLQIIRPRVIICEHNSTIPITIDVYAEYTSDNNFGCSALALVRIAKEKGYKLVALTLTNAIFVLEKDFPKFEEFETDIHLMNVNSGYITLVTSYDGKYILVRDPGSNYFHGVNGKYDGALKGSFVQWDGQEIEAVYQVKK